MSLLKTSAKKECDKAVSAKQSTYAWVADKNALHGGRYQEVKDCGILGLALGASAAFLPGRKTLNGVELRGNKVFVPDSLQAFADPNGDGVVDIREAQRLFASGAQVVAENFFDAPEPTEDQKDGGGTKLPEPDEPERTGESSRRGSVSSRRGRFRAFGDEEWDGIPNDDWTTSFSSSPPSEVDIPTPAKVRRTEGDDEDSDEEEEDSDNYSSEDDPIEEDEVWEDARQPPPKTKQPKSPGLFMLSTKLNPSALLHDHIRF